MESIGCGYGHQYEQVYVTNRVIKRWPCRLLLDRFSVRIPAETPAILIQILRDISWFLLGTVMAMLRLGHEHCLPDTFQFIIHQLSYNPTMYAYIYTYTHTHTRFWVLSAVVLNNAIYGIKHRAFLCFFTWFIFRHWRCRRHFLAKHRLPFIGTHSSI